VNSDRNVIPPMDHELSQYWDQPALTEIEVDDTHALMSEAAFEQLYEYSASRPTGAYEGKMWKGRSGEVWYLQWFGKSTIGPGYVSNNHRVILVVPRGGIGQ